MQTVARNTFTTVKSEGAILPADLLQYIIANDGVEGLDPTDYHLAPGEKLNEAISRAWNRCLGVWQTFDRQRQTLAETDSGVTLTRERWLLVLFQELGYGRLPYRGKIEVERPKTTGSPADSIPESYPISHVWGNTPIHLLSFKQSLDRRDSAVRRSPHSLLQEFLNRSESHLWGFVSNGLQLRILRDNISLTRAAYVEFDLEAMMTGENYADFRLLWLVCHQSRVEILTPKTDDADTPALPSDCWLERWSQHAADQGTRALDSLRDGVQEAIAALGRGFLAHKANADLRQQLQHGELSTQNYYRQLLRLVYRLIFLFVAEDRDLLLLPDTPAEIRHHYTAYYSLARLRTLAEKQRGGPHPDLYRALRLLMGQLRSGYPPLGLPALGGFLFSERSTPALDGADIANADLLAAIRELAFTVENGVRRPVDYKNLGAEELGSVYESLLELHPQLNIAAATFTLQTAAGSERKTTGSYYTPTSLINNLLDTALEPVVAERLKGVRETPTLPSPAQGEGLGEGKVSPEAALLSIKVVDPACGSGHFLIAAANRLALHLARIRTGDDEPGPAARREALRDVVRHCIFGVDINEMSVELTKVSLWMETLDPGKPLTFLDANIQCGNSLFGTTPALLKEGIPDAAFKPITGDDKTYCRDWKAINKKERKQYTFDVSAQPWDRLGNLAAAMAELNLLGDATADDVRAQEEAYVQLLRSSAYEYSRLWADAWCAAFVWPKKPESAGGYATPITEAAFRKIERNPFDAPNWMRQEIEALRDGYQFFHWHLAFPQVFGIPPAGEGADNELAGWNGGFDVVLGNPPWERIKLQEREYFATRDPDIAGAPNAAARRKKIAALKTENPALHADFEAAKRKAEGESAFVRNSGRYPLCGRGDVNTYTIFAELSRQVLGGLGRAGIIVPSGIATDDTTKYFFQDIVEKYELVSFYDFSNKKKIFEAVKQNIKFCLLTLSKAPQLQFEVASKLDSSSLMSDKKRLYMLSIAEIQLINPNTLNCPTFETSCDAELTKAIYRRAPVLINEATGANPWGIQFMRMFDMSNDSHLFRTREQFETDGWILKGNTFQKNDEIYVPLYESKLVYQFNHRLATFDKVPTSERFKIHAGTNEFSEENLCNPKFFVIPRYWIAQENISSQTQNRWFLGFRNAISAIADSRSFIASIIPLAGIGNSMPIIFTTTNVAGYCTFLATINSFVLDYVLRQKASGGNLNFYILKQLPVLPPKTYSQPCAWENSGFGDSDAPPAPNSEPPTTLAAWLLPRVLELTYTAWDLRPFAQDCGYHGAPFRWDEDRRFLLRCELDAAYFHLYGISREDAAYILDTFPIVKRKDIAAHGEYRTQRVILEIYDEIQRAIDSGQPYQTRLNPPPADSAAAHPWDTAFGAEPSQLWVEPEAVSTTGEQTNDPAPAEEPFTLQTQVVQPKGAQKDKSTPGAQQAALLPVMPAPAGTRNERLKRAKELAKNPSPVATRELVALLADTDANIRWLAGAALAYRLSVDTVAALRDFLAHAEAERVAIALPEARQVLTLAADSADDAAVRAAARSVLASVGE